jgi:hypothetical protein
MFLAPLMLDNRNFFQKAKNDFGYGSNSCIFALFLIPLFNRLRIFMLKAVDRATPCLVTYISADAPEFSFV